MDFIIRLVTAGAIFAAIDAVWLLVVANKFYKSQMVSANEPGFSCRTALYKTRSY